MTHCRTREEGITSVQGEDNEVNFFQEYTIFNDGRIQTKWNRDNYTDIAYLIMESGKKSIMNACPMLRFAARD
ncbi:MAG: hypothetical protein KQH63_15475 [Desulfobulbaceae bacterium]|nr:hypothetical protein [Desulfobulbaceae bacterium]